MGTMPYTTMQNYSMQNANAYKRHEIEMASPVKLILHTYDLGIQACERKDNQKAGAVFATLIDALDFNVNENVSVGLYRLYEFCIKQVHQQDFDVPKKILKELRETWTKAMKEEKAA